MKGVYWTKFLKLAPASYKNSLALFFFILNWTDSWHNYSSFLKLYTSIFFTLFCLFSLWTSFIAVISVCIPVSSFHCLYSWVPSWSWLSYLPWKNQSLFKILYIYVKIEPWLVSARFYTYILHTYVTCVCVCTCESQCV